MAVSSSTGFWSSFDHYQVNLSSGELLRSGERVPIQEQPFQILRQLLEAEGRVVTREELRAALWPEDTFVDFERGVNTAVKKVRQALEDSADRPRFVETLPKIGYRFLVPVRRVSVEVQHYKVKLPHQANGVTEQKINGAAQTTIESAVAHEQKASAEPPRNRRLLAAGLVAAAIGVLVAGFLFLRIIGKSYRASPGVGHWVAEQRVTSNPPETPVVDAVVSPDGKYIVYADTTGLYLRQISTGEAHPWPLLKGFVAWPDSWFAVRRSRQIRGSQSYSSSEVSE